jgi:hypothetical protein
MKGFVGLLLLALGTLVAAASCNGANEVTGVTSGRGGDATPTPHPRLTPNPCRQNPSECGDLRSGTNR